MTARGESSWPFPPEPSLSAGSCLFPVVCPALCAHAGRAPLALGSAFPWSSARRGLHHPGQQPRSVQQTGEPYCGGREGLCSGPLPKGPPGSGRHRPLSRRPGRVASPVSMPVSAAGQAPGAWV